MPKGQTPERELTCRACGQPFRTDRCGRAAYYCRTPECDEQRRATGVRIQSRATVDRAAAARAAEREVRRLERDVQRTRDREVRTVRRRLQRLVPKARAAVATAQQLIGEVNDLRHCIAELEGRPLPARPAQPAEVLPPPTGHISDLVAVVRRDLLRRDTAQDVGRPAVQKAVVHLAHAEGTDATRHALHQLAVECLAWELRLPEAARGPKL